MEQLEALRDKKLIRIKQMIAYFIFYFIVFTFLEHRSVPYFILDSKIDYLIPFVPVFIVPYILWFAFLPMTVVYFAIIQNDDNEYNKFAKTVFFGNTLFLLVSLVFPNGQNLRPDINGGGIFTQLTGFLYSIDTATNVLPSLHVFDAVACCTALVGNQRFKANKKFCGSIIILTVSIVLATMFIKQHTIIDVITALLLNILCYQLFYKDRNMIGKASNKFVFDERD